MASAFQSNAFQNNAFQTGAAPVVVSRDMHDGFDEESHRRAKAEERKHAKDFRSRRERLRDTIARAYDPEHGKVAEEVQALAAPYVERLESGAPRIDYAALERNAKVMAEILAFQDALRVEYRARIERENDDEDVMLLTALWN